MAGRIYRALLFCRFFISFSLTLFGARRVKTIVDVAEPVLAAVKEYQANVRRR
jgi:hypothetical protein